MCSFRPTAIREKRTAATHGSLPTRQLHRIAPLGSPFHHRIAMWHGPSTMWVVTVLGQAPGSLNHTVQRDMFDDLIFLILSLLLCGDFGILLAGRGSNPA
jgi:hypothetical protein